MKKKEYTTLKMKEMEMNIHHFLLGSGRVKSELGIGYGGVDEDGILDPAAPKGLFDLDEWDEWDD